MSQWLPPHGQSQWSLLQAWGTLLYLRHPGVGGALKGNNRRWRSPKRGYLNYRPLFKLWAGAPRVWHNLRARRWSSLQRGVRPYLGYSVFHYDISSWIGPAWLSTPQKPGTLSSTAELSGSGVPPQPKPTTKPRKAPSSPNRATPQAGSFSHYHTCSAGYRPLPTTRHQHRVPQPYAASGGPAAPPRRLEPHYESNND